MDNQRICPYCNSGLKKETLSLGVIFICANEKCSHRKQNKDNYCWAVYAETLDKKKFDFKIFTPIAILGDDGMPI